MQPFYYSEGNKRKINSRDIQLATEPTSSNLCPSSNGQVKKRKAEKIDLFKQFQQQAESNNPPRLVSFKRKVSTSKYKGVLYVKSQSKWRAQVCLGGKKKYIGSYDSELEAALARDNKIKQLFGDRPELMNFPRPHMFDVNHFNPSLNAVKPNVWPSLSAYSQGVYYDPCEGLHKTESTQNVQQHIQLQEDLEAPSRGMNGWPDRWAYTGNSDNLHQGFYGGYTMPEYD